MLYINNHVFSEYLILVLLLFNIGQSIYVLRNTQPLEYNSFLLPLLQLRSESLVYLFHSITIKLYTYSNMQQTLQMFKTKPLALVRRGILVSKIDIANMQGNTNPLKTKQDPKYMYSHVSQSRVYLRFRLRRITLKCIGRLDISAHSRPSLILYIYIIITY